MLQWDYYAARVRQMLFVKTLPTGLEQTVRESWEAGLSPELAADECNLILSGAYDERPGPRQGTGDR